ncbi:MAG: isopentenyl-diphosphate Delta-isomerase [Geodermatophilaceae bacterium]|jgi:isopentenyl-diphosphate delta-isomerase|nr:isopentenyl-diphosphate Delta-isomerase [Geodermatophilaceae bacterium]
MSKTDERVVLLDEQGRPIGDMPKSTVHHQDTPLHLAFSCWVMDVAERVLVTRRSAVKRTWPLAWSNAICGHPTPGEDMVEAVRRRAATELGLTLGSIEVVLPDFRYTARMANGIVENEICPVFRTVVATGSPLRPDPAEVADWRWTSMAELRADVATDPDAFSPWMIGQLTQLG